MRLLALTFTLLLALVVTSSAAFAAPATVDTSTAATATASSAQRKTFFDSLNNTHWAFYYNGAAIEYSYSADGVAWTSAGSLAYNTASFSVVHKTISGTSYVWVVAEANTYDVVLRRGSLDATAITFDSAHTVLDGTSLSNKYTKPTIAVSENNHLWISGVNDYGAGLIERFRVAVRRTTNTAEGDISVLNAETKLGRRVNQLQSAVIMPQNGNNMYLISTSDGASVVGYVFDGSSWSSANTGGDYSWFSFGKSGLGGEVRSIAVNGTDIYFGGYFFDAGGISAADSVAKWDGNSWSALGSNGAGDGALNNAVSSVMVNGSDVYVGGWYTDAAGIAEADYLAKWDGNSWSALGSNGAGDGALNSTPYAMKIVGSNMYVAGQFSDAGGVVTADAIAKWDGSNWSALGSNGAGNGALASAANSIVVSGTDIYVGGWFENVAGIAEADYLAKWDGSNWSALGSNGAGDGALASSVSGVAINGSELYVGGSFTNAAGIAEADYLAKWDGNSWSALGSNGAGDGAINNSVLTVVINGSDVYVGGQFSNAAGIAAADSIAKWNGSNWNALGSGLSGGIVNAIAVIGSDVYVGGSFSVSGVTYAAKWDGATWGPVANGGFEGVVYAVAISGSDVYVGGDFYDVAGLATADRIVKWDGNSWSALGSNGAGDGPLNSIVLAIAISGSDVYVGGSFTNAGAVAAGDYIARWNGATWSGLGTGLSSTVNTIAVSGANVYAGGSFLNAGSANGDRIARWDGAAWNALSTGLGSTVRVITISGTDVYAGGNFLNAGTANGDYIARWDGASWNALGTGLVSTVYSIAISGSDVYVGGAFTDAGGVADADRIARWNGTAWNALGSGLGNTVRAVAIAGSNVYVGGVFTDAGGIAEADRAARWDGVSWHALGGGLSNTVYAMVSSGSDVYFAGETFNIPSSGRTASLAFYSPVVASDAGLTTEISTLSDTDGNVYFSYTNDTDQLRFRRFDESDASWGAAVTLNAAASTSPSISYRATGGRVTTSWVESSDLKFAHALSPYGVAEWSDGETFYGSGTNASVTAVGYQETADLPLLWTNGAGSPYNVLAAPIVMSTGATVILASNAGSVTSTSPIPITITFSKEVTGFVVGDLAVGNGTAGNFAAVDGATYTADITPTAQGAVTVNIAAGVAKDSFDLDNLVATQLLRTFDTTAPTVLLSSTATDPTNDSPFTVTIQFNEPVTGFVIGDITVGNGTAGNFIAIDGDTYTADITPTTDGAVTVDVAGAVAEDAAGNDNAAAVQLSRVYDNTIPSVGLVQPAGPVTLANRASFALSGSCSENTRAVSLAATSSGGGAGVAGSPNCAAGAWSTSLNLSGLNDGTVTFTADHEDAVGLDAVQASRTVNKETSTPSVSISSSLTSPTEATTIPITILFSEAVTGFAAGDISVVNATLSGFTATSAQQYRANLSPTAEGAVRVNVAAAVAQDSVGNVNTAASELSITYQVAESEIETDTVCSVWNSFFNNEDGAVWNILEHVNKGSEILDVETTLYSQNGVAKSTAQFSLSPEQRQLDLLVHEMAGWEANSYGLVCSKVTSGVSNDLDGRMAYYRQKPVGGFEYAFASPFSRGSLGRQYVGFNTFQPSLNTEDTNHFVANWIQITNLEDDQQIGELLFYDQAGELLRSEIVSVPGIGQTDISAHEWDRPLVGLAEWRPDDEQARFIVRNTRYLYDNAEMRERFDGVIQVPATDGSKQMLSAMIDTQDASSILELANITGSPVQSKVKFYDSEGDLLADLDFTLPEHSSQHVIADAILDNAIGSVTIAVPGAEVKSIIATVIQYGREPSGSISHLYGISALRPVSDVLRSSYNTYLGQGCELHLLNQSESEQTATIGMQRNNGTQVFENSSLTLQPMQSVVSNICVAETAESYGVVTLTTSSGAAFHPYLLRRDDVGGSRYAIPVR